MVRFGPSGNSDSFYAQGHKSTLEMPVWLKAMGLNAFEYPCTRGIKISPATAAKLGDASKTNDIRMSVHAPYYINLSNPDETSVQKSIKYIVDTAVAAKYMGADRVVFHPGTAGKGDRTTAYDAAKRNLLRALEQVDKIAKGIHLCPETAGKRNQLGSLDEIIDLCNIDSTLIPTLDFGHLHAYTAGSLKTKDDFKKVFERLFQGLGENRARNIHIHFSRIEYTEKGGEKKHWTYDDVEYGPDFDPLAACLVEYGVDATVISESRGTMAEDSAKLKKIYDRLVNI